MVAIGSAAATSKVAISNGNCTYKRALMKVCLEFVSDFVPKVSGQPRKDFSIGFNIVSLVAQLLLGVSCQTTFMTNF